MVRVRFLVCDVFTNRRFGGNQLAVVPEASGLSDVQMQQIAREFNFSESAFVFPPVDDCTRRVRIFTPATEVPFAGHPNVGTAFVLASIGELGEIGSRTVVTFDEKAGRVPVDEDPAPGRADEMQQGRFLDAHGVPRDPLERAPPVGRVGSDRGAADPLDHRRPPVLSARTRISLSHSLTTASKASGRSSIGAWPQFGR